MNEAADEIHERLSIRNDRVSRVLVYFSVLMLATASALGSLGYASSRLHHKQWDPLGPYPTQQVINRDHLVHLDGTVDIFAKKCAKVDEVAIRGDLHWVPVNHPEASVLTIDQTLAIRYRSCGPTPKETSFSFHNPIPVQVAELVGQGLHIWQLSGTDVPFDRDGSQGVPRTWRTETFTIQ